MKLSAGIIGSIVCLLIGVLFLVKTGYERRVSKAISAFNESDTYLQKGNSLLAKGFYQEAVNEYETALQVRPGWDIAQDNIAVAKGRIKDLDSFPASQGVLIDSVKTSLEKRDFYSAEHLAWRIKDQETRIGYLAIVKEAAKQKNVSNQEAQAIGAPAPLPGR